MMAGVEPTLLEAVIIGCGIRRQRQKLQDQPLFSGPPSLGDQTLGVVWILNVLVSTIVTRMTGDQLRRI